MKKKVEEEIEAANEHWYEVFELGKRGPSIDIEQNKMLRFQKHLFLKF